MSCTMNIGFQILIPVSIQRRRISFSSLGLVIRFRYCNRRWTAAKPRHADQPCFLMTPTLRRSPCCATAPQSCKYELHRWTLRQHSGSASSKLLAVTLTTFRTARTTSHAGTSLYDEVAQSSEVNGRTGRKSSPTLVRNDLPPNFFIHN